MRYKVIVESCQDPAIAQQIALALARYSGYQATTIYDALLEKMVCIKSDTDEREAVYLKEKFEGIGASVCLEQIGNESILHNDTHEDEDNEETGRILSDEEYVEQLKKRSDIFYIEKETRLRKIEVVCLIVAICLGVWLSTTQMERLVIEGDFYDKGEIIRYISVTQLPKILNIKNQEEVSNNSDKKSIKPSAQSSSGNGRKGGGGDPLSRVVQKGLLGIMSGKIKGRAIVSADIFGKGGFAKGIDGILSGLEGLKSGGDGGVGRKSVAGIGFGAGYGSGFDGGSGGIDGLMKNLMKSDAGAITLKKRKSKIYILKNDVGLKGTGIKTSGRNKGSIMRVVMQNLNALRYAYNKRLREKPGLKGRITCRFAIDEFGKVLFCDIVTSSMDDPLLEQEIVNKIRRWVFEKIDRPGDVTEVVYPFVFTS